MNEKEKVNQITEGVIWKQLLLFFFPIVFGTFFQQIYNTADTIVVGRFVGKQALAVGHKENLERLYKELLNKDWFMTLLDLEDYIKVKDQAIADYEDRRKWQKMMLVNIAKAGFFSSDRTIMEYNRDIWKLK